MNVMVVVVEGKCRQTNAFHLFFCWLLSAPPHTISSLPHRLDISLYSLVHFVCPSIMASYDSSLRLQFLQNAASLLCSGSISTASHLMVQHNGILHEDSKSIKLRQHESWCNACGAPRQPRYTKVVKPKYRSSKGKTRPASIASREAIVYRCLRCSSRTVQRRQSQPRPLQKAGRTSVASIQAAPSSEVPSIGQSTANLTSRPAAESSIKTTSENASSKKRAKARKQGGLQALLASKRSGESTPSSSSLDLFDFLQQ